MLPLSSIPRNASTLSDTHSHNPAIPQGLLSALAPVTPHMAEDAWLNLPWARPADSVFQSGWAPAPAAGGAADAQYWQRLPAAEAAAWEGVLAVREAANAVLEKARIAKLIGPGLEAALHIHTDSPEVTAALAALAAAGNGADELRFVFITSEVHLAGSADAVAAAAGGGNGD